MQKLWRSISRLGITADTPAQAARVLLLTNRLALILLILSVLLAAAAFFSLEGSASPILILGSALFYIVVLALNGGGYINSSRLMLSAFVPLANMFITIYAKEHNAIVDEHQFFTSRLVLLITAILPLMLFHLKEKKLLFGSLLVSFLCLLLYDPLHYLFGVGYYQLGYRSHMYGFITYLTVILYLLEVSAFLYYKLMLEKVEDNLEKGNQQLTRLFNELGKRHEEIQTQAEMLGENQQQLEKANKLIQEQKLYLQEEVLNLRRHLLEKNYILEASNRELHKRLEEMQQFSYTISHNLRGPVASLLGLSHLFNMEAEDTHNRVLLQHVKTAATALDTVIWDLAKVLQVQEGKQPTELVDLPNLLENVLLSLKQEQEECAAEIDTQLCIKQVPGIKSYLHSILYNLISNAFKYYDPARPCHVKVSSKESIGGIVLEVSDNGTGIDMQRHGHNLFKMYKRFQTNKKGRGLGLYLLKVQAEVMGGYVDAHSQPGEGTTFTVWLPRQEKTEA